MGERTSYPPGTFSWAELATSDADAAKSFYSTLSIAVLGDPQGAVFAVWTGQYGD